LPHDSNLAWLRRAPPRRRRSIAAPPGHYYERGFPVLSAGPRLARHWQECVDEDVTVDIHCVTKWSKRDAR